MLKEKDLDIPDPECVGIPKNIVESFGIRHNGCELIRVRIEYPFNDMSGTAELIKERIVEYSKIKLKERFLSLPIYHTGMRAKYSFLLIEKVISDGICYIEISAELLTNIKNETSRKTRHTYLYSIKENRFILPQYVLPNMLCRADKKLKKKLFRYLKQSGRWLIKRDELYIYENGQSYLAGRLRVT